MRATGWWKTVVVGAAVAVVTSGGIAAATMSDAWITAKTKTALLTSENVPATSINVDTVDGVVTLHGTVHSADQKARAEQESRKIDGVKNVRNLLQVVPESQKEAVKASDNDIKKHVQDALKSDATLKDSSIAVQSVNNGVVLLDGTAKTVSDHVRALQLARGVSGVRQVKSEVKSPDRLADAEIQKERDQPEAGTRGVGQTARDIYITSATKMRFMADEQVPAMDVNVDTRNGTVTLFGIVPSEEGKRAAEADARKVSGVQQVRNELEVVPKAKQERVEARDDDLQKEVAQRLKQRQDLEGANVDVEVKNGVARLTGKVTNEEQRLTAAIAARSTPGVRAIHDELRVETARSD